MDQVVHRAVALGGDFRRRAAIAQVLADRIAVIALVGEHGAGITVALLHQLVIGGDIMCLALAQHRADGKPRGVAAEVDLGGEAAARAAERLVLNPPFSPAAQRCARTVVLSIICNASASPPLSANASNTRSHTPERHQRRNCLCTEFQFPSTSGKSRHGAPVRLIQNTPSNTLRWSFGGATLWRR